MQAKGTSLRLRSRQDENDLSSTEGKMEVIGSSPTFGLSLCEWWLMRVEYVQDRNGAATEFR